MPPPRGATEEGRIERRNIEAEVRHRAEQQVGRKRLVVDYYRIRRRLAYPLPVVSLSIPSIPVPTIPDYPWSIWMLWELEERVNALGWAAEWAREEEFARLAARDLGALSAWPKYSQLTQPDLASGHAARLLWTAEAKWNWLSEPLRERVRTACLRHVQEVLPLIDTYYGHLQTKEELLRLRAPAEKLHNIALIGTLGAALAAQVSAHPAASRLHELSRAVFGAILDLRAQGFSEGVAYDGYVLDFVADWLAVAPTASRTEILEHPRLNDSLDESTFLGAPGAVEQLAEIGDVEPRQMPFHISAQAKLARLQLNPGRSWLLRRWPLDWMHSDGLAALHAVVDRLDAAPPPPAGASNAHYSVVLRSGWEKQDLAVAMSCSNSPMDHIQNDNGTLVIGTERRWLIADPGYEQYIQGPERDFTLGPAAHNCPVINGVAQDRKRPSLLRLDGSPDGPRAQVELAGCYPPTAGVRSAVRSVWLVGAAGVVVCDQIAAEPFQGLTYHWHGHPDAAWWSEGGWMLLHLPDAGLWFTSPQVKLSDRNILRLPGSRGQLTLEISLAPPSSTVWWVFALSAQIPQLKFSEDGKSVDFLGKRFES